MSRRLKELIEMEPTVFLDDRGSFFESYSSRSLEDATGISEPFVQDNHSRSAYGVVRGLHYQLPPHGQGKIVRCLRGAIFDVAVDIRQSSPTFGQWSGSVLTAENRRQLWIPVGFAHGYMALTEAAEVLYKNTELYAPDYERSIRWNDPAIAIEWPRLDVEPVISTKDACAPTLAGAELYD